MKRMRFSLRDQRRLAPWAYVTAGAHFGVGGLWPLVSPRTFARIMGPKTDTWLMNAISLEMLVSGASIASAARNERITPEIAGLAIGSNVAMAGLTAVSAKRKRVGPIYYLDALGHVVLALGWVISTARSDR